MRMHQLADGYIDFPACALQEGISRSGLGIACETADLFFLSTSRRHTTHEDMLLR